MLQYPDVCNTGVIVINVIQCRQESNPTLTLMEILCFYAGIAFIYVNRFYPFNFSAVALYFRPKFSMVLWFLAAVFWGLLHQYVVGSRGMPNVWVVPEAELMGKIISIPVVQHDKVQFTFFADRLNGKVVQTTIAMACYAQCPELHAGQYWRLVAKLKKPRNLGNPGGFNYVSWLQTRHVHWSGTVRRGSFQVGPVQQKPSILFKIRERLLHNLAVLLPDSSSLGITEALTLGVTSHIDKAQWELFRHTGTTHLIDISGAHIGMVAGFTYTIVNWVWSRMGGLCLYWPAQRIASVVALIVASIYTIIAGFAVPAQRALIACTFMLLRYFFSQRFSVWQAWRYALLAVLFFEPHSVMLVGFYLSFIGVAIIVLTNQRIAATGIRKSLVLQLACVAGLMPLTLFWFSYGAVDGILANIFAIPWVELWIVPLALLITLLSLGFVIPGSVLVLKGSISLLLYFLTCVDSFSMLNLTFSFEKIAAPAALMLGLSVCLFFPLRRLFYPILIMVLAAVWPSHIKVREGEARIDVMDVGQGLAVVVNTAHHALIYDTCVKFFQGSEMAKIAIIPYLRTLGIKKLDKIVISHPDLDHLGGLKSLEESFPVQELLVDSPEYYHRGSSCHEYPSWEWDGVSFRFFAITQPVNKKNNHSCVLQISTRAGQLLLTGDIEKSAEDYLVATYGKKLASSIMLIPHHASKTSSSIGFVDSVSPHYAIASYGFDNRYHFPHREALHIYEQRHIPILNTVSCGMVTIILASTLIDPKPSCYVE